MKKLISVLLAIAVVFGTGAFAFAENKTSVPEGYIGIYTAEDLNNIRNNLSGKYILMNDIDLSVYENWEPIGTTEAPFTGELDGNGYVILNLIIDVKTSEDCRLGLFGYTKNAKFNHIKILNADITAECFQGSKAKAMVGILSGYDFRLTGTNLLISGNVYVSGFETIFAGGLFGYGLYSYIDYASNYSDVTANVENNTEKVSVGGVIGQIEGSIRKSANFGTVSILGTDVSANAFVCIGGIEGDGGFDAAFLDSYNRGSIFADFSVSEMYVGGLSGLSGTTQRVYNAGEIELPEEFNGFAGGISGSINTDVFTFGELPKMSDVYYINEGFVPGYSGSIHPDDMDAEDFERSFGEPVQASSQEMMSQSLYKNFDFEKIWEMEENGYPVLKNQPTVCVKESVELVEGDVYSDKIITSEWKTTSPDVATVNENGEIVAVGVGEATITVKIAYGYTEEITVAVLKNIDNTEPPTRKCWIIQILIYIWGIIKEFTFAITKLF